MPRTWLVFGTCCSSPSRTSVSSSMSSTTLNQTTGSPGRWRLTSRPLSGRYFPHLLPSALAGVGKPPKPASLLPPPPPFLPLLFLFYLPFQCPSFPCGINGGPPVQYKEAREIPLGMHGQLHVKEGCLWLDLMRSPACVTHWCVCYSGAWPGCAD